MHIGLLCQKPEIEPEDEPLARAFRRMGWTTKAYDWKQPLEADEAPAAMLVRSTWDYQDDVGGFLAALDAIGAKCPLYNPPELIRWNADKRYLLQLAEAGVPVLPTRYCARPDEREINEARARFGDAPLVVKRAVGAGAKGQAVLPSGRYLTPGQLQALTKRGSGVLIQPFLRAFETHGEWSLVFFGDELVASVHKLPKAGDYRVQLEYGGSETVRRPPAALQQLARQVISALPLPPLYARIDLLAPEDQEPLLVEAELIEPRLYFNILPELADLLAGLAVESLKT